MSDDNEQEGTTPEGEGSPEGGTPDPKGSGQPDELSLARRRQAGAEAARQVEKDRADRLEAELAPLREANQTAAQKDLSELARQTARADAAERERDQAKAEAEAKFLDKVYPNARKELPEVTDEVRLAKFEALLAEEPDPGTPPRHNEARPTGGAEEKKPKSVADLEADILSTPAAGWQ